MSLLAFPALASCASDSSQYPSLAVREAERPSATVPEERPVDGSAEIDAGVLNQVNGALTRARSSHQRFVEAQPQAMQLARSAQGSGFESDARARAQVMAARLNLLRGETQIALSELDSLEAEAKSGFVEEDPIRMAQDEIKGFVTAQNLALLTLEQELLR